jgi:hypothetical protein
MNGEWTMIWKDVAPMHYEKDRDNQDNDTAAVILTMNIPNITLELCRWISLPVTPHPLPPPTSFLQYCSIIWHLQNRL